MMALLFSLGASKALQAMPSVSFQRLKQVLELTWDSCRELEAARS